MCLSCRHLLQQYVMISYDVIDYPERWRHYRFFSCGDVDKQGGHVPYSFISSPIKGNLTLAPLYNQRGSEGEVTLYRDRPTTKFDLDTILQ